MEDPKNVTITDSEWMVMRAIWTMGHATSRELIDAMNELEGWSASTTKTLLHRLIQKQAVAQHGGSRPFTYKPVVGEKESMAAAADYVCDAGWFNNCRRYSVKGTLTGGYCELTGDSS